MNYLVSEKDVYEFDWMPYRLFNMLFGEEASVPPKILSIIDQIMWHPNVLFKAEHANIDKVGTLVGNTATHTMLLERLLETLDKPFRFKYYYIVSSIREVGSFAGKRHFECVVLVTQQEHLTALFRKNTIDEILRDLT